MNKDNWMGDKDEPLTGFSWKSSSKRVTSGVIVWSDVFLHKLETTGEKLAIILMDTQGLFDSETSHTDNAKIFALGSLISSVEIFNLFSNIQEDHLQYLQFATEFAKSAAKDNSENDSKPFQKLLFLIRLIRIPSAFDN